MNIHVPALRHGDTTMPKHDAEDDRERGLASGDSEARTRPYGAAIVTNGSRPTECTIYPIEASVEERLTTWITAREGSFVGLGTMR